MNKFWDSSVVGLFRKSILNCRTFCAIVCLALICDGCHSNNGNNSGGGNPGGGNPGGGNPGGGNPGGGNPGGGGPSLTIDPLKSASYTVVDLFAQNGFQNAFPSGGTGQVQGGITLNSISSSVVSARPQFKSRALKKVVSSTAQNAASGMLAAECAYGTPGSTPNAFYQTAAESSQVNWFALADAIAQPSGSNSGLTCSLTQTPISSGQLSGTATGPAQIIVNFVDSSNNFIPIAISNSDQSAVEVFDLTKWIAFDGSSAPTAFVNNAFGYLITIASGFYNMKIVGNVQIAKVSPSQVLSNFSVNGELAQTSVNAESVWNGAFTVYDNVNNLIATSTVQNLTFSDGCNYGADPISGVVSSKLSASTVPNAPQPVPSYKPYVNATETLTFTGCGSAKFVDVTGAPSTITFTQ
jgi:hypothetical protein